MSDGSVLSFEEPVRVNCPECGRFMRVSTYYTSDSYDSEVATWRCTINHRTKGDDR